MRKNYFTYWIFFLFALTSFGQNDSTNTEIDSTTFVYGNVMYEKANFRKAINVYEKLIAENGPSATIYYNLGNCYYKTGQLGLAVLNYERVLFFESYHADAKYNLELTNMRIRDKIDPINKSLISLWWNNFIKTFSTRGWGFLCLAFLCKALIGFSIYRVTKILKLQQISFYFFVIGLFFFVITFVAGISRNIYDENNQFAVVISPSTIVKSEPNESSTNLTLLHEGIKLKLLRAESEWSEIKMPDGNVGWIKHIDLIPVNPDLRLSGDN